MNIYFVRHGAAEEKTLSKKDSERILTEEGKLDFRKAVTLWIYMIPSIDNLVTSPYIRAVQTAEILKDVFAFKKEIIRDDRLRPGSSVSDLIDMVNELLSENTFLFGHEPDFSEHISKLISSSGANINMKKGSVAKVSFPGKIRAAGGVLEFLIPPFRA